jgi:tetratricopeptide (TPR) repeat protein
VHGQPVTGPPCFTLVSRHDPGATAGPPSVASVLLALIVAAGVADNAAARPTVSNSPLGWVDGEDVAEIERRLQEAATRAPGSFQAQHDLGEFYLQQDKLEAAIPHLERSQAIDPTHYVNGHDLALAYLKTGRVAPARQQIQRLLQVKETAELHNLLGDTEEAAGNLMAAADAFQKAAHMDPTEEHLFDWANNLLQLRAYQPATEVLGEGVKLHPRSARLQVALGIAHYSRGQFDDAIRTFCAAADLEPDDPRTYLFLGEMYGVSAELSPEVTRRLARFVEKQPGHALGHFYYAMSLWKTTPGAVATSDVEGHLKKAAALDPSLAKAHFQLGVMYADQRRYPEAITALEQAVRLVPEMAQAHYRLSQAYRRTGREDLAQKALEVFERLQPR